MEEKSLMSSDAKDVLDYAQYLIQYYQDNIWNQAIDSYKAYLSYMGDRMHESWQSNVAYPLTPSVINTMTSNMFDSAYAFHVSDPAIKKALSSWYDHRQQCRTQLVMAFKEALITGKCYLQPYLKKITFEEKIRNKTNKVSEIMPSFKYLGFFDVISDPSFPVDESPVTVIRSFLTYKQLKSKYEALFKNQNREFPTLSTDSSYKRFSDFDPNMVKNLLAIDTEMFGTERKYSNIITSYMRAASGGSELKDTISFFYTSDSKQLEVLEVVSGKNIYLFANREHIVTIQNIPVTFGIGKIKQISYSDIPGTSSSVGIAGSLRGMQGALDAILNSFIDNITVHMNPMFTSSGDISGLIGKGGKVKYEKYKILKSGSGEIKRLDLGINDFSGMNAIQVLESISEKNIGVNEYITGGQGKVERIAGAIDLIVNQYKSRLNPITNSINKAIGEMARDWLFMAADRMDKKQLERYGIQIDESGDELKIGNFLISDLILEDKIIFDLASLRSYNTQRDADVLKEQAPFLIQYMGNQIDLTMVMKGLLQKPDFDIDKILKEATIPMQQNGYNNSYDKPYNNYGSDKYENNSYNKFVGEEDIPGLVTPNDMTNNASQSEFTETDLDSLIS